MASRHPLTRFCVDCVQVRPEVYAELLSLIQECWRRSPCDRPKFADIRSRLSLIYRECMQAQQPSPAQQQQAAAAKQKHKQKLQPPPPHAR